MGQAQRIVDRHSVSRTSPGYFIEQVQPIWDRHSESSTGSTYQGQAQRIEDRHSNYRARNTVLLLYSEHCPMSLHGQFTRFSGRFSRAFLGLCKTQCPQCF